MVSDATVRQVMSSAPLRAVRGRTLALVAMVAALSGSAALSGCGERQAPAPGPEDAPAGVTHLAIDRALDVGTQALLKRAVRTARSNGSDTLVIEIDTPGGRLDYMSRYAGMIEEAAREGLMTVAWVSRKATSAGALITLTCDRVYMRSSATMGSATVVTLGPQGMVALPEEGGIREKAMSDMRSEMRATAETHSRSPVLAEAMVDVEVEAIEVNQGGERRIIDGVEWEDLQRQRVDAQRIRTIVPRGTLLNVTGSEAVSLGLADGTAETMEELLSRVGKGGVVPVTLVRSRSEELLSLLDAWAPLLLGLALLLGWMEIKSPGFGLPGIAALVCFAVLLVGRYMTGLADVPHLVLVVLGLALVATELFLFPGSIWIGLVGGVMVIGGLLAVELGPGFSFDSALDRSLALDAALQLAMTAGATLVGAWILSRFLPQVPVLNRIVQVPVVEGGAFGEALPEARDEHARSARVGELGRSATALRPVGKVVLDVAPQLEYEARADGDAIDAGTQVEVLSVSGGRLLVRARAAEAAASKDGPASNEGRGA